MIKSLAHVNIAVSDMNQSIDFYCNVFGLELIFDRTVGSEAFSKGTGLGDNVQGRIAMFKTENGATLLELIEYTNPVGNTIEISPNTVPAGHVAFQVENLKEIYNILVQKGISFISEPQTIPDGVSFCYLKDPDGALLELIEFPAG